MHKQNANDFLLTSRKTFQSWYFNRSMLSAKLCCQGKCFILTAFSFFSFQSTEVFMDNILVLSVQEETDSLTGLFN